MVTRRGPVFLGDPLRHPSHALGTLNAPLLSLGDRVRLARLVALPSSTRGTLRPVRRAVVSPSVASTTAEPLSSPCGVRTPTARRTASKTSSSTGVFRRMVPVGSARAKFQQPPHARRELPATSTRWPGLYLASEITEDSSLNGAMRSGEAAARAVAIWARDTLPGG